MFAVLYKNIKYYLEIKPKYFKSFFILAIMLIFVFLIKKVLAFDIQNSYSSGDTAWQLIAATLVGLQSIPGLALMYAGMVSKRYVINTAFMVFYAFSATTAAWILWAYGMAFGYPLIEGFIGFPKPYTDYTSQGIQATIPSAGITANFPMAAMVYFQLVFAAITIVILSGSVLERMNFKAWLIFVPLWITFDYSFIAFWIWGGGFLFQLSALDFCGGYVIHLNAGIAALAAALAIGPRKYSKDYLRPNNPLLILAGAGILWLGWNGFNGGCPIAANTDAAIAILNTNLATSIAVITWIMLDILYYNRISLIGSVNGMIAGLVAITPAAGIVSGYSSIIIGILGSSFAWLSMNKIQRILKVDDSLRVFSTHAIPGLTGGILTGIFVEPAYASLFGINAVGAIYGNIYQLLIQILAAGIVIAYSFLSTLGILQLVKLITPLRIKEIEEKIGDLVIHGESQYEELIQYGDGKDVNLEHSKNKKE
jgi:Amt family ammonium transporter